MKKMLTMFAVALSAVMSISEVAGALPEPTVWFSSDSGVTVQDGAVIKWANKGSLGADFDVNVTGTGGTLQLVPGAFGKMPAVRFDGKMHLKAATDSNLGLSTDGGATVFVVSRWDSTTMGSPIGVDTGSNDKRFYFDVHNKIIRLFYYWASGNGDYLQSVGNPYCSPLLTFSVSGDKKLVARLSGAVLPQVSNTGNVWGGAVVAGKLCIGHGGHGTRGAFTGDVAEIRVYNQDLDEEVKRQIEAELAAKYGFESLRPTVCYAVDEGVQTEDDRVTKWSNSGVVGEGADLVFKSGTSGDVVLAENVFGTRSAVVFDGGGSHLRTSGKIDMGLSATAGSAVFVVSKWDKDNTGSPFGVDIVGDGTGKRFYCDLNNGNFRYFYYWGSAADGDFINVPGDPYANSIATFTALEGCKIYARLSGLPLSSSGCDWNSAVSSGYFCLGVGGSTKCPKFKGAVAECRVYNRSLASAEVLRIESELSAKYGLDLKLDATTVLGGEELAEFGSDRATFGDAPNSGCESVSTIPSSGTSGALSASFAATPVANANTLVLLANDGVDGKDATWLLAGASGARSASMKLSFAGDEFVTMAEAKLCHRANRDSDWYRVDAVVEKSQGVVTFTLPANWQNGEYRISEKSVLVRPAVWLSADEGVTIENGAVTKWANHGTMGSVADVEVVESKGELQLVSSAIGGNPAVRFDGKNYLKSKTDSTFGLSDDSGATVFIVSTWATDQVGAPFGIDVGGGAKRLYCDYYSKAFRFFYFWASGVDGDYLQSTANPYDSQLISLSVCRDKTLNARMSGALASRVSGTGNVWAGSVVGGKLCIGHSGHTTRGSFTGDIAEIRLYNRSLTAAESAQVELELAMKYGLTVSSVGAYDPGAIASHSVDFGVVGTAVNGGEAGTESVWTDSTLRLSVEKDVAANVSSLTAVGSDGGSAEFIDRTSGSAAQEMVRTWYVVSATPAIGRELEFACDTEDAAKWKYLLYCKADGSANFTRAGGPAAVGEGVVTFAADALPTGTYKLVRRPSGMGLVIVVE